MNFDPGAKPQSVVRDCKVTVVKARILLVDIHRRVIKSISSWSWSHQEHFVLEHSVFILPNSDVRKKNS